MTVRALADAYVLYRATKRLGRKTLADDRYIARKLIDALGAKQAHEVLPGDIRKLLDAAPSESTARKIYKVVSLIFDYGKENRALAIHPMIDIDRPEVAYVTPTTLTPSQFGILLNAADDQLLPYLAIAGFAGLRRSELVRQHADDDVLDWSDIDFNKRLITVRDTVAKATQRKHGDRRFIPMEDALVHWLGPIKRVHGSVVPVRETVFSRQMRRLHAATGIAPEPNALRHSFASYWLARAELEGVGALAKRMGNSESVARRHYIESLSPAEGQAWFAIRRAETRTAVLPFPKSAA
jgi:integrase